MLGTLMEHLVLKVIVCWELLKRLLVVGGTIFLLQIQGADCPI